MANNKNLFTGRSGQLALMAEFLIRELNVAIPEVDIGDDVVVVRDDLDEITRVQVKTANAEELKAEGRYTAQFNITLDQLENGPKQLVYAFVVRRLNRWEEFIIVRRSVLFELHTTHGLGSIDGAGGLLLRLSLSADAIVNKAINLHAYRSRFLPWPPGEEILDGVLPPDSL